MNNKELNINRKRTSEATCFGTGLVALDVIMNGNPNSQPKFFGGGSCGNVLLILSFLGWKTFPIARLSDKPYTRLLFDDFERNKVCLDLITQADDGSTPMIIHRILKDTDNNPRHRYEFRVPDTNIWLPSYKPVLSSKVAEIYKFPLIPRVFYLDRVSRSSIELAAYYKDKGSLIYFEPSSMSNEKQFKECLALTDILKFSNDRIPKYKDLYPLRQAPVEIETLGANGLLFRSFRAKSEDWKFLPAINIDNALDTAGAGDWCSAGLIHTLHENFKESVQSTITNYKLEQALKFGQFLSALNCCFYGARGLMYNLSYKEIKEAYGNYFSEKRIELKRNEPGFKINNTPFDFSTLL